MRYRLSVSYEFLPKQKTTRTAMVMDRFGIQFDQGEHQVLDPVELECSPQQVLLFTGPSGSGKSSLLKALAGEMQREGLNIQWTDSVPLDARCLIDQLPGQFDENLALLIQCGLGDAHLLLRTPQELSEGQRYRFRLAMALAANPDWVVADEFGATLDRDLARIISMNLRRIAKQRNVGILVATTHEDLAESLSPHLHIRCDFGKNVEVVEATDEAWLKKKESSSTSSGSQEGPSMTGRPSLGGIIAATPSA